MANEKSEGSLVGKVLLGYELTNLVTTGGSSEIYTAKSPKLENREVVIKIAKRAHTKYNDDLEVLAKKLDRFNHPNIVGIFNVGEYEARNFLVLEKIDGSFAETMNKWNRPKKNYESLVKFSVEALKGLEEAHNNCVFHQDITPGNILTDKNGTVKITDFFAPEVYEEEKKSDNLASLKSVKEGKQDDVVDARRKYLAPEQKELINSPVDGRTDIYSLAMVLYEALMNNVPFGNYDKISEKHKNIPKWFEKSIEKALAGSPNKRWNSAKAMRDYLEQGLEGKLDEPSLISKIVRKTKNIGLEGLEIAKDFSWAVLKGTGYVASRPFVWSYKAGHSVYDYFDTNPRDLGPAVFVTGMASLLALGITLEICAENHRNKVREALKDKKGIIAYVDDNKVGLITPAEFADPDNKSETVYSINAKDLVGVKWRNDGKKLLLIDEPKRKGWQDDVEDTALYVFDIDSKRANKILDITESEIFKEIIEAYWSKSKKDVVYARIDKDWHMVDASRGPSANPQLLGNKIDFSDIDKSVQMYSLDKKIEISPSGNLQFNLLENGYSLGKDNIESESAAWYHSGLKPKDLSKEQKELEKQSDAVKELKSDK